MTQNGTSPIKKITNIYGITVPTMHKVEIVLTHFKFIQCQFYALILQSKAGPSFSLMGPSASLLGLQQ